MRSLALVTLAMLGLAYAAPSYAQPSQSAPQPGLPPGASVDAPNAQPPSGIGSVTTTTGGLPSRASTMAAVPTRRRYVRHVAVHHYHHIVHHVVHHPAPAPAAQ